MVTRFINFLTRIIILKTIFVILFSIGSQCYAQKIQIQIRNENNIPLENVMILNETTNENFLTNYKGIAFINQQKNERLLIHLVGYSSIHSNKLESLYILKKISENLLDEIVITTEKSKQNQIINEIDIHNRPINNSQEILNIIPGLFIGQHAGGGKAEQLFVRGFDIDHGTDFQIDVDGLPVNMVSHAHGQGYADLHFLMPELVQNVAYNKGGYLAEKGNFSTSGWASFKTKDYLESSFAKIELGMFDTYRTAIGLKINNKNTKNNGYVAAEQNFSNSYFDAPQKFNRTNLFGKYHYEISPKTLLTLSASYFGSKWNHSGQIPNRAVEIGQIGFYGAIDSTEGGNVSRFNVNSQFNTQLNENANWHNQFYFIKNQFELFSNFTFFLEDAINGDQIKQKENRNILGFHSTFQKKHSFLSKKANLKIGFQNRYDIIKNNELSHTLDRTKVLNLIQFGDVTEINSAFFAEESIKFNTKFLLDLGLRIDYFHHHYADKITKTSSSSQASVVSPKINIYYQINTKAQLYLTNGKSFHSNDTRVVVPENGRKTLPSSYGSDLGLYYKPFDKLIISTALWYIWLEDELVYVGDAGVIEPSGKSFRKGIDFLARSQISKNWFADLDINYTIPKLLGVSENENHIPLAPKITSAGGFGFKTSNFSSSFRTRYLANRPANETNSIVAEGYFVCDLNASYLLKKWTFGMQIFNVLNTKWKETQFATESRLQSETEAVEEIHFTPGTPFSARWNVAFSF